MTQGIQIAILLLGSYLLGSLPFGLWLVKAWKGLDIRTVGSGNIGATNVARVAGGAAGRLVFVLDLLKGVIPPLVAQYALHLDSRWVVLSAMLAILGHNFSLLLGFKGGKGISTSGGALFGTAPLVGLAATVVFSVFFVGSGIVSVGSLMAAITLPFLMLWLYPHDPYRLAFAIAAALMAIYKHRKNIERLRAGTEPRVLRLGGRKTGPTPETPAPETQHPSDRDASKDSSADARS